MTASRSHSLYYYTSTLCLAQEAPSVSLATQFFTREEKLRGNIKTYIVNKTLTSQRTVAGYDRGARVRTLVPSRILPRASLVDPNSCSQEDLAGEEKRGEEKRREGVVVCVPEGG